MTIKERYDEAIRACEKELYDPIMDRIFTLKQALSMSLLCSPPDIEIDFKLRGKKAGMAYHYKNLISINPILALENKEYYIRQTIGHEVCHIMDWVANHHAGHGKTWREIMRMAKLPPNRCHQYDVISTKPGIMHRYKCYKCGRIVLVTQEQHDNKIKLKRNWVCRKKNCGGDVHFDFFGDGVFA